MALRAPLGLAPTAPAVTVNLLAQGGSANTRRASRTQLRVASQAGWSAQNPLQPGHRARDQSPSSRVRAVAAPERQPVREQQQGVPPLAAPQQPPANAANAILPAPFVGPAAAVNQEQREALERLLRQQFEADSQLAGQQPALDEQAAEAAALLEAISERLQQSRQDARQEEEEEEKAAAEEEAQRRERLARSAAASTSGRSQEQPAASSSKPPSARALTLQQQQRDTVPSTRRGRARGAAAAAAPGASLGGTRAAAAATAADLKSATTLRTWLLDCASRRARSSRQPLNATSLQRPAAAVAASAAKPAVRGAGARAQRRVLRSRPSAAAAAAAQLGADLAQPGADVEDLSEETRADMAALINARLPLSTSRRFRRKGGASSGAGDAMGAYMRSLGNTAVLGRQQEAVLAGILQKGLKLESLAVKLAGGCPEGAASVDLARLAAEAGLRGAADAAQVLMNRREAKDLLMQYNVRLVINIAKRYANNGIELEDLIPEGMVGLSKSLDRFEPAKGFKFSTYAHWWIRQAISRAVCDQSRVVRLPSHVCEVLYRINRALAAMSEDTERDEPPGYEEIAAEVGLPVSRVIQYLRLAKAGLNTERATSYIAGNSLKEVSFADLQEQEGDELGAEEEELEAEERAACMRAVTDLMLGTLDKRERNILRMRYGLLQLPGPGEQPGSGDGGSAHSSMVLDAGGDGCGATMSLGDVAVAYGLSKERIRQIEDKAMRALRKPWRMQLVRELSFGHRVSSASLSEFASARQQAAEEGRFL